MDGTLRGAFIILEKENKVMSFILGNHTIDEILMAVATDTDESEIYYSVDQLSNATITITSDPREITDKNGNVVRRIYKSKNGEFSSTNAFLHPAIMNAGSGSTLEVAAANKAIAAPKIQIVAAGGSVNVTGATSIKVIGIYGNGANSGKITASETVAEFDPEYGTGTYTETTSEGVSTLTVPAIPTTPKKGYSTKDYPVNYMVMFTREMKSGVKMTNTASKFPDTVKLTLYVSYVDLCSDSLRPAYVVLPSFMADPSVTINLSSENQEQDFNGTLQIDYCSGDKVLYYIYYPDEDIVETGAIDDGTEGN